MKELTVIDTIVKYSKDCIIMRFTLDHLQKSLFLAKHLPTPFILPSVDTLKIVIEELKMRIDEREGDVGKLLIPLFEGKDFGHKDSKKHSLTLREIRDGYILLDGEKYVILLRELKHPITHFTYSPGVLYEMVGELSEKLLLNLYAPEGDAQVDLLNLIIKKKTAYEYLE